MKTALLTILVCVIGVSAGFGQGNVRSYGLDMGVLPTGSRNAITDVAGVLVGHQTLIEGDSVRTGVTVVRPHGANLFTEEARGRGASAPRGSGDTPEVGERGGSTMSFSNRVRDDLVPAATSA